MPVTNDTSSGVYTANMDDPSSMSYKELNRNNSNHQEQSGGHDKKRDYSGKVSSSDLSGFDTTKGKRHRADEVGLKKWKSREHSASQEQLNMLRKGKEEYSGMGYENTGRYDSTNYQQMSSGDSQSWTKAIGDPNNDGYPTRNRHGELDYRTRTNSSIDYKHDVGRQIEDNQYIQRDENERTAKHCRDGQLLLSKASVNRTKTCNISGDSGQNIGVAKGPTQSTTGNDLHQLDSKQIHTRKHEMREDGRHDNKTGATSSRERKTLANTTAPLNAKRLRPIRQRTRNAMVRECLSQR